LAKKSITEDLHSYWECGEIRKVNQETEDLARGYSICVWEKQLDRHVKNKEKERKKGKKERGNGKREGGGREGGGKEGKKVRKRT
jgi:hypothetical protein